MATEASALEPETRASEATDDAMEAADEAVATDASAREPESVASEPADEVAVSEVVTAETDDDIEVGAVSVPYHRSVRNVLSPT